MRTNDFIAVNIDIVLQSIEQYGVEKEVNHDIPAIAHRH